MHGIILISTSLPYRREPLFLDRQGRLQMRSNKMNLIHNLRPLNKISFERSIFRFIINTVLSNSLLTL